MNRVSMHAVFMHEQLKLVFINCYFDKENKKYAPRSTDVTSLKFLDCCNKSRM